MRPGRIVQCVAAIAIAVVALAILVTSVGTIGSGSSYVYDGGPATPRAVSVAVAGEASYQAKSEARRSMTYVPHGYDSAANFARALARPGGYRLAPNTAGVIRHGPLNPGPLADDVAGTFRTGTYNAVTSAEPTTLYRVYSDPARQLGPYWTRTRPTGPVQSIIDNALYPAWGNRATSWTQIRVPGGTTFYEGAAAAQRGLVGGGNQVFLPWVDDAWVVRSGGF